MNTTALGLIEVKGYVGAIEAADAALKAANVILAKVEKIKGGLVTVMVTGDVGAVKAAVEAGTEAAEKCSTVLSSNVIARVHEETNKVLIQPDKKEILPDEENQPVSEEFEEETPEEEIPSPSLAEEAEENSEEIEGQEKEIGFSPKPIREYNNLEGLTVEELRKLARSRHLENVKPNEIKYGRKEFLLKILMNHFQEVDGE